jgi:WD and tetratricopeptide repeats protein 1
MVDCAYAHYKYSADAHSPWALLSERARLGNGRAVGAALQGHAALMKRLAVDATLAAHSGCVNHLRWNASGTLLASGSDDTKLIVWDYATRTPREQILTGHRLNIFAVCFVPHTHDHILATGAMDKQVRIHYAPFRRDATRTFRLHTGRVKDIASSQGVPKVFWSVGEDGLVYQFDVRALPATDGTPVAGDDGNGDASGLLIRLGKARNGTTLRGMAMAAHPLDATKVVVACGDFYSRMFDRRMLRTQPLRGRGQGDAASAVTSAGATLPVEIFAPPHLHMDGSSDPSARHRHDDAHGTSIQFSSNGTEILANYHNDHIYLFRSHHEEVRSGEATPPVAVFDKSSAPKQDVARPHWMDGLAMDQCIIPPRAAALRSRSDLQAMYSRGLVHLMARNHNAALGILNELCSARKTLANMSDSFRKDVYHALAKAYLGRAWHADEYVASQFAKLAESLAPHDHEVQLTLIRSLQAGRRSRHVTYRAKKYQTAFPLHSHDVEAMLSEATTRQLQLFRQSRHADSESSDDDSSDGDDNYDGGDNDEEDRDGGSPSSEGEAHEDLDPSSESSSDELHIEEEPIPPDSEDGSQHESEDPAVDGDARFWKSPLRDGLRVNCDVAKRFIGYANLQTDIKEACFFGPNDECIVAGSDDGRAYIWHKNTGKLLNAIHADADIVNCVQPHPFDVCLATSGIEDVVRLWTPTGDGSATPTDDELEGFVESNQTSMASTGNYYLSGRNPNIIRLIFNSTEEEGVQECATS